jgi:ATP synthase protein I
MTTDTEPVSHSSSAATALLRGAAVPALLVSIGCVAVAAATLGATALWGSLVGATLVCAFFAISALVLGATRTTEPALVLLVALGLYTAKVVALAVTFILFDRFHLLGEPLHRGALAVTVIACTLTWTTAQIVAAVRHRQPLYDLGYGS